MQRILALVAVLAVVACAGLLAGIAPPPSDAVAVSAETLPDRPAPIGGAVNYIGVSSCAAAACHGGRVSSDSNLQWKSSYTVWASQEPRDSAAPGRVGDPARPARHLVDKHNRAFSVLFDERSKRIVQLLDHLGDIKSAQPQRDARCLACHSVPLDPRTVLSSILADGVGCELCHGPAKSWLTEHTKTSWLARYHSGKSQRLPDMDDTASLTARVRICAGCHVGSPARGDQLAREVNHDLIAAGHPRLNFEFHSFLAVMPKHWNDVPDVRHGFKTDRQTHAEAWAIGQTVAAEAALNLLAARAEAAAKAETAEESHDAAARPVCWPEFAEYDCYACHHQLGSKWPSARQTEAEKRATEPKRGSLPWTWGTWYFPEVQFLIESEPFGKWPEDFGKPLTELGAEMAKPIPVPDPTTVNVLAKRAAESMHRLADRLTNAPFDATTVDRLLQRNANEPFAPANWDAAAGRFLTLESLWDAREYFRSQPRGTDAGDGGAVTAALEELREKLHFPGAEPDTERIVDGKRLVPRVDSPTGFDPIAVSDTFKSVFARLRELPDKDRK